MDVIRKVFLALLCIIVTLPLLIACQSAPTSAPVPGQQPTPTQTPEDFHFSGVIESIGSDKWVVGGETFRVDQNTELDSGLAVGVSARVEYFILTDGTKLAREIETP
jgi:hypothetical protein